MTEVGGATYVIDAKIDGVKRGMSQVKAEFREVQKEADRVARNGASAMRAFGTSMQSLAGASANPAQLAKNWQRATGQLASDMDRFSAAAKAQGITFAEMTQRLIHFKDAQWRATKGQGDLYNTLKKYDVEAATALRLSSSRAQSEAIVTAAMMRTKDATARAAIETAAYGVGVKAATADAAAMTGQIGTLGKAMAGLLTIGAAQQAFRSVMATVKDVADIGDLAANIGMTTDQLQELQYAFAAAGISAQESASGLQRFAERLADAHNGEGEFFDILMANNVALREQDGTLRSSHDILQDFANVLMKARSAEEALNMSVTVFGKTAGRAFLEALRNGKSGLEAMAEAARTSGGVISEEQIKAADEIDNRYNALSESVSKYWQTIVVNGVQAAVDAVSGIDAVLKAYNPDFSFGGALKSALMTNPLTASSAAALQYLQGYGSGTAAPASGSTTAQRSSGTVSAPGKGALPANINPSTFQRSGSGSGRNKRPEIDEVQQYIDTLNQEVAALQLEIQTLGLSDAAKARAAAMAGLAAGATDAQRAAAEKAADAIARHTDELEYQTNAQAMLAEETKLATEAAAANIEALAQAQQFFADEMKTHFFALIDGTETVADAFKAMSKRMIDAMLEAVVFGQGPFAGLFGGASATGSSGGGGLFGSILGAIFKKPSLYAAGGSASGPIMVGEEGPELLDVPGGSRITPTEHVSRRVQDIIAGAQRSAMAPALAMGQTANQNITLAPQYNIDARGAQVGFATQLRQELDARDRETQRNLPAMMRRAKVQGKI